MKLSHILTPFILLSSFAIAAEPSVKKTTSNFGIELVAGGASVSPVRGVMSLSDNFDFLVSLPTYIDAKWNISTTNQLATSVPTSTQLFSMPFELRYETALSSQEYTNLTIGNTLYTYYEKEKSKSVAGYGLNVGLSRSVGKNTKVLIGSNLLSYHGSGTKFDYVWTALTGGFVSYQIKF